MFLTVNHQVDATFGPANTGLWGVKRTVLGKAIVKAWLSAYPSKEWYFDVSMQRWAYIGKSVDCNIHFSCFQYNDQGLADVGRRKDGQMDRGIDRGMVGRMDRWTHRRTDGWTCLILVDAWMDRGMNRRTD